MNTNRRDLRLPELYHILLGKRKQTLVYPSLKEAQEQATKLLEESLSDGYSAP